VLLAWERAGAKDRAALEKLIADWQPENFAPVKALLVNTKPLNRRCRPSGKFLEQARLACAGCRRRRGRKAWRN